MYITKQTIVGLAVANPLTRANRLISSTLNHSVDYASEESYPALCGISRIWVLKTYRRKRIASRLLDAVRYVHIVTGGSVTFLGLDFGA